MTDKDALIVVKAIKSGFEQYLYPFSVMDISALDNAISALKFKINHDEEQAKMLDDWSKEYGKT